jgi:hypothetical protein
MAKKSISQRNMLVGDVVEIKTKRGYAYAQCVAKLPFFGNLIRVMPGLHKQKVTDLETMITKQEDYFTFFFWDKFLDRNVVYKVGRFEIPDCCVVPILFRGGTKDPKTRKVAIWWLWDSNTNKEWRIDKLTKKQRELPIRSILNYIALINYLEMGWHPRDEH